MTVILYGRLQNALSFGLKSTPGMPAGAHFGIDSSATRQNVAHFGACSTPGMLAEARFGIDSGAARQNVARFPVGA